MSNHAKFVDATLAYQELKALLEQRLGRDLTEKEDRTMKWLSDCEFSSVGTIFDLFDELSNKSNE
ncbi:hypothetical protein [Rossellomorea marisflavi]|uniref:hypothetical protein n=1 Tax=Rossellomorea marisflavi TaxID=189381 RepID=UPI003D2F4765